MENNQQPKTYHVPENIATLKDQSVIADMASIKNGDDGFSKGCIKFDLNETVGNFRVATNKDMQFWKEIHELYPELGESISYDPTNRIVFENTPLSESDFWDSVL